MNSFKIDMKRSIDTLRLQSSTKELLKNNKICTLNELIKKKKGNLKKIGCTPYQIEEIEIQLQLEGLDLNTR